MRLNTIKPDPHRTAPRRVGRGGGSGLGKTCGRGHKGQRARAGGYHKLGFEGGQMPLQRRLPKFGFRSAMAATTAAVRLGELKGFEGTIDLAALKAANVVGTGALRARVFLSGTIDKALVLKGVSVTKGARAAIEAAGGRVED
ncbi:50S ribosomal protein L15 [Acidiferrobacter sp.]|uniref:50S ribosomal protein L15 n=1 Tax=Acidiferrobacter sp. TaxID=1872107 RepID=UPI002638DB57|nr:50S ribosomal protein L15 [Acidiferrobacter sp.]